MEKKKPKGSSEANHNKNINFVPTKNDEQGKAPATGKLAQTEEDEDLKEKIKQKIRDDNEPEEKV